MNRVFMLQDSAGDVRPFCFATIEAAVRFGSASSVDFDFISLDVLTVADVEEMLGEVCEDEAAGFAPGERSEPGANPSALALLHEATKSPDTGNGRTAQCV